MCRRGAWPDNGARESARRSSSTSSCSPRLRARNGNSGKINEARQAVAQGEARRLAGQFKDAIAKYKDAVSKADGA